MVESGEVLGGAAASAPAPRCWRVVDTTSGKEKTFGSTEPTSAEIIGFKNQLGYSSVKVITKDAACKRITIRPVDKAGVVSGEVLGDEEEDEDETWFVEDTVSGKEKEFDGEPSSDEIIGFKNELGYASVKIVSKDTVCRKILIRPVDKAGRYL